MCSLVEHKRYVTIWPQPTLLTLRLLVPHAVSLHKLFPLPEFSSSLFSTWITSEISPIINLSRKLILTLPRADLTIGPPWDNHSAGKTSPL